MKRDAAADLEAIKTGNLLDSIVLGNDALPYWIREAQAQKDRAEEYKRKGEELCRAYGNLLLAAQWAVMQWQKGDNVAGPMRELEQVAFRGDEMQVEALALRSQLAEKEREINSWEEREAAICPEDVGFEEHIKSLRARLEEAERRAEEILEERNNLVAINQAERAQSARLREALATAESLLGEIQAGADQVNADLKRGREAEEELEKARAALEHQRTALCIIRDRQHGRVSAEDLNQGIRQIDQTLSRLRESCPTAESEGDGKGAE